MQTKEEALKAAIVYVAKTLDGLEYAEKIDPDIIEYAKRTGIVIVFGASDDLMEFRGAIDDEASSGGGGWVYFNRSGELRSLCDSEDCPYFDLVRKKANKIEAIWISEGYSWTYKTDIPHETFDIMEEGDKYCRGIVFSVDALNTE